jgi:hypothetical protein
MHVVRKVSSTLLKVLDLPANWINGLLYPRGIHWKFFRKGGVEDGSAVSTMHI